MLLPPYASGVNEYTANEPVMPDAVIEILFAKYAFGVS
jgi:hypothetical protein